MVDWFSVQALSGVSLNSRALQLRSRCIHLIRKLSPDRWGTVASIEERGEGNAPGCRWKVTSRMVQNKCSVFPPDGQLKENKLDP